MVKDHMKRISSPRRWHILRKDHPFISRPNAGRDFTLCVALNTALKELLTKTKTTKESKYLIKNKGVMINGKPVFDEKFPVGFMDVISFPLINEHYRLLVNEENKLFFLRIREDESHQKLSKVMNKKILPRGVIQLNCTDGRNFNFKPGDKTLADLKINDTVVYSIPAQEIKQVIKLEKGTLVYLYKGKHIGNVVCVEDFKGDNIIFMFDKDLFETKKAYAFALGKDIPVIAVNKNEKREHADKNNKEKQEIKHETKHESKPSRSEKKVHA
ncbi:hypothetical protein JW756_01665 [Candidatus Woesearchaeota archaeon]|nr:hypothetical protein [Candidatus Woesearchaeota archaeon]